MARYLYSLQLTDVLDKDKMNSICEIMDLDGMSDKAKEQVQEYIIDPPKFFGCLRVLSSADDTLRYGAMINMVETAWADDELDAQEGYKINWFK